MGAGESHGAVGVLTVDDKPLFRMAAAAVVEATPGFVAVGEAASGREALGLSAALDPDLVLVEQSGAAASVRKQKLCPGVLERLWAEHRPR